MKQILALAILVMLAIPTFAENIASNAQTEWTKKIANAEIANQFSKLSMEDFLTLTPSKYKKITGQRLKFKEVVALKSAQIALKKEFSSANKRGEKSKSQLVALLLAIFLGVLGIHRFYLGYPLIGFLQLITCGFCLIGYFVDIVRIAFGTLKPSRGREYDEAL
jgi:hypothetical protein